MKLKIVFNKEEKLNMIKRYKTIGARNPNNPNKTLSSKNPYTLLLIKRIELDLKFDDYKDKNKWYNEYEKLDKKIDKYKEDKKLIKELK